MSFNIAVVGATGNVGRNTIDILAERNFPVKNLYCFASPKSRGKKVAFGKEHLDVQSLENFDFKKIDIAFFAAGANISSKYVPNISKNSLVIDKSSFFRMDSDVPLIVPEVNAKAIESYKLRNIISNPNCVAIPLSMVLKPLQENNIIKRVVITTFQSVSGAGKSASDELFEQTKGKFVSKMVAPNVFPKQIAFNIIPSIGAIMANGETQEEYKIKIETQKILESQIPISVTCVRVPVFNCHSISANIEFESFIDVDKALEILEKAPGVVVVSNHNSFSTPVEIVGEDSIYVSRVRNDESKKNALSIWIVSDNLRKGAALNAVHIAETLLKNYL